jgi:hypothetical protein
VLVYLSATLYSNIEIKLSLVRIQKFISYPWNGHGLGILHGCG